MKARLPLLIALVLLLLPAGFMGLRTYLTLTVAGRSRTLPGASMMNSTWSPG